MKIWVLATKEGNECLWQLIVVTQQGQYGVTICITVWWQVGDYYETLRYKQEMDLSNIFCHSKTARYYRRLER